MNTIPNPDNWMDVATILLVALIAAVPSWLALRSHKAVRDQAGAVEDIKAQVVNGHEGKPALRADIDMIREEIAGIRDELRGGFAALRGDIGEERATRRSEDAAIRDQIARRYPR